MNGLEDGYGWIGAADLGGNELIGPALGGALFGVRPYFLPGIEKMIDQMPLGRSEVMAQKIVAALEQEKEHLFYPWAVAFAYALPMLVRWRTERAATKTVRSLGPEEWNSIMSFVARSGSMAMNSPNRREKIGNALEESGLRRNPGPDSRD